jgi:hypothetical protein
MIGMGSPLDFHNIQGHDDGKYRWSSSAIESNSAMFRNRENRSRIVKFLDFENCYFIALRIPASPDIVWVWLARLIEGRNNPFLNNCGKTISSLQEIDNLVEVLIIK